MERNENRLNKTRDKSIEIAYDKEITIGTKSLVIMKFICRLSNVYVRLEYQSQFIHWHFTARKSNWRH